MRRRKTIEGSPLLLKDGQSLIKVAAVLLRDHSYMDLEDAIIGLAYCWKHTESIKESEKREKCIVQQL